MCLQFLQWCVPMYGNTRMCFLRANEGSFMAENLLPLLPRLTAKDDIVLVNFGLHSNDDGSLRGYIKELEAFAAKYKELESQLPQFVWRQTSTQHFDSLLGTSSDLVPYTKHVVKICPPYRVPHPIANDHKICFQQILGMIPTEQPTASKTCPIHLQTRASCLYCFCKLQPH